MSEYNRYIGFLLGAFFASFAWAAWNLFVVLFG